MKDIKLPDSVLTKQQYKSFGPRAVSGYGDGAAIWALVRYDDECGNGHNSFSITGRIEAPRPKGHCGHWDRDVAGGCLHEEIAKAFPELAPLIKWHLCSPDGPMHYLANVVYFAGDRGHSGKRKGEPSSFDLVIKFKCSPIEWSGPEKFIKWLADVTEPDFEVLPVDHKDNGKPGAYEFPAKYTLGGYDCEWYQCPFDTERQALQFLEALKSGFEVQSVPTAWSDGKERELDAARHAAIWPEATDAELSADPDTLRAALLQRLPGLMEQFKAAVESLGFIY